MLIPLLFSCLVAAPNFSAQEPTALQQIEAWSSGRVSADEEGFVFAKLRGTLFAAEAAAIAQMLADKEVPRRNDWMELLLQVPYADSHQVLFDFALDETRPSYDRGRVAEFLLLLDGHEAFDALKDSIRPDAEPPYMRRVYAGWRESIQASDLPLLELLATTGEGYPAEFALQLWAMHETNQAARLRIYRIARERGPNFRAATWQALSRGGFDPEIAAMLRAELDGGDAATRRIARSMLVPFAGPEAYLAEYKERAANLSVTLRSRWVVTLAGLSLPEAQQLAMDWLLDGGWNAGGTTQQVVMLLSRSETLDSMLPVLFQHPEIPDRVLFPLALARSATSEDAKAFLIARLPDGGIVMQMQIARAFAAQQTTSGLEILRDIAESAEYTLPARSLARELLVPRAGAEVLVERWLQQPLPSDYEIAASWLRALAESENADWRMQAIRLAQEASGYELEDECQGFRLEVWSALGRSGNPAVLPLFEQRLQQLLQSTVSVLPEGVAWDSLYRLGSEYPEINTVLEGLRRCATADKERRIKLAEDFQLDAIPSDLLLLASAGLAYTHPATAAEWFRHLLARDLSDVDHLRVQCLIAHRITEKAMRQEAYQYLLNPSAQLQANHRIVREAFSPDAAAWLLMQDRIADLALLLAVEDGTQKLSVLQSFLAGYVEDEILHRATELAIEAQQAELALDLAQRRVDHSPLLGVAHAALAELQQAAGEKRKSEVSWGRVLRMSPDRSALWTRAKAALDDETP